MATKLYTIENLLVGKTYRSTNRHFEGTITHAEKREGIWYGENTEAYVVQVDVPKYLSAVSYTHLTLPTKRIV